MIKIQFKVRRVQKLKKQTNPHAFIFCFKKVKKLFYIFLKVLLSRCSPGFLKVRLFSIQSS